MYEPGQANAILPFWDRLAIDTFVVGGPADGNEAQTIKKATGVQCVGFEPNPRTLHAIKNFFPGELYPYALWNEECYKDFYIMGNVGRSSRLTGPLQVPGTNETYQEIVNVRCVKLDDVIKEEHGNLCLWLDIEHSERQALEGAKQLLSSGRVKLLNVEIVNYDNLRTDWKLFLGQYGLQELHLWNGNKVPGRWDVVYG